MVNRKSKHLKNKQKGGTLEELMEIFEELFDKEQIHMFWVMSGENYEKALDIALQEAGLQTSPRHMRVKKEDRPTMNRIKKDYFEIMARMYEEEGEFIRTVSNGFFDPTYENIIMREDGFLPGKKPHDRELLKAMLNILNTVLNIEDRPERRGIIGEIVPEPFDKILEELRKDIIAILYPANLTPVPDPVCTLTPVSNPELLNAEQQAAFQLAKELIVPPIQLEFPDGTPFPPRRKIFYRKGVKCETVD